ncbi:MAG TPA: histidine kinase, partial [Longilinea sp.]|nr:histidine kinase [Longilinea sp.]
MSHSKIFSEINAKPIEMKNDLKVLADLDSIAWTLLNAKAIETTLIDRAGLVISINQVASQYIGKPVKQIIGHHIWDFIPIANEDHFKILLNQVITTHKEICFQHKDRERWVKTLIYPVQEEDNQVTSIALCSSDITPQVEAEEKLKRVLMELVTTQEDERHRISQDLHDDVGQKMTALLFELRAIKDTIEHEQKVSHKEINSVIRNLETIIKHVRQIFYQLYPPSLSKMDLPKVLEAFCSTFEEANNLQVDFSCQEEIPELPDVYNKAIYRFIQEGLTNVV